MSHYDQFAADYDRLVVTVPVIRLSYTWVLETVRRFDPERILDVGCGQGALTVAVAETGAQVTGVDISRSLLDLALRRFGNGRVSWLLGDATRLPQGIGMFDCVVSNLMLMDIDEFERVFSEARDHLRRGGVMVWTVMHPCFQSPHSTALDDGRGRMVHRRVVTYDEGHWRSDRPGTVRGTLGAWHRSLSTYLNTFSRSGFVVDEVAEPVVAREWPLEQDQQCHYSIPPLLGVVGLAR